MKTDICIAVLSINITCTGLGAALMQKVDNRLHPIAYANRKLNATEKCYSVKDLEALALVWSLKHFREVTDHHLLCYLLTEYKFPSGRQAQWIDILLEFNPAICYTQGATNKVADSLSHTPTLHLNILDKDDVWKHQ